ncbi:MAG: HD domain-containing protein [Candidatus Omnitrophica bacterium]|nr:HD domain-containing protein [Candidatus Omnitrophota bacterium]MDD5080985.1 HD domain-containing protein [Candidatus Omnitrophota bacterium]
MKRYNKIFSTYHMVYRLANSSEDQRTFALGIGRVFKNSLAADKIVIVFKHAGSYPLLKVKFDGKTQTVKSGGKSILTIREREIFASEREITQGKRMMSPFNFGETLGGVYLRRKTEFLEWEQRWFLSLCETMSLGVKLLAMRRDEKRLMVNYVKSLTRMLHQFVPTSYLHTSGVIKLVKEMGKEMRLTEKEINALEYASLLHDAGKTEVPTELLNKKATLTQDEYDVLRKHPNAGADMLKNMEMLKPALPIIRHHHERYDGKGYPSGLKKQQIPLGARILAIIDAFDAMYFGRPYKGKISLDMIKNEFKKQSGKQFDGKVVEVFLKVIDKADIKKHLRSCL